jgi:hypothetical protein
MNAKQYRNQLAPTSGISLESDNIKLLLWHVAKADFTATV